MADRRKRQTSQRRSREDTRAGAASGNQSITQSGQGVFKYTGWNSLQRRDGRK
jgi:hypothetical protein